MNDKTQPTTAESVSAHSPKRQSSHRAVVAIGSILLILSCFAAGFFGGSLSQIIGEGFAHQQRSDGNQVITADERDISSVVKKVGSSVVSIVTSSTRQSLFAEAQRFAGAGTGMIVDKNGYILTNKHVVEGADTVSVVLSDGTQYDDVKVVGADPLNDVAFLKIAGVNDLPAVELGDSKTIRIGQKVIAIGNALGQYQNTVTSGIISGTGRPITAQSGAGSIETLNDLIQTDAAINEGNSGGPLLNMQGQVIGINTAVAEDAQGIGFAIPIAAVKGMLKGVLAGDGVEHPYLGVRYIGITPNIAKEYDLPVKQGSYIFSGNSRSPIVEGGPADKAGLKSKDIITKVNGIKVGDKGSVASLVAEYRVGNTIELTVIRGNDTLKIDVTLGAYKK